MVTVKLMGTSTCRRYQKMHTRVTEEAKRLKVVIQVEEVNDTETLSQFNPLSMPRLYINGTLVASQNPPQAEAIRLAIRSAVK